MRGACCPTAYLRPSGWADPCSRCVRALRSGPSLTHACCTFCRAARVPRSRACTARAHRSNLQPVVVEAAAKTVGANIPLASRSGPGMRCSVSGTVTEMLQNACENAADYHLELSAAMTIEAEHRWGGPPSDSKAVTSAAFTAFYGRERLVPASRAIRAAAHTEDDDNADEAARSSAAAKLVDLLADCREEDMDIDVLPRPSTRHGKGKCRHDCTDAAHGHDAAASGSSDARPRRGRSAATAKGDEHEDEDDEDEDEDEDEDDDSVPRMPLPPAKELRSVWAQVRAPPPPPGQHPDLLRGMRAAAERVGLMATAESAATDLAAKDAAYMAAVAALPSSKAAVQAAKAAAKGRRSAASAAELAAVKAKREEAVEAVAATRDARDAAARQVARFRDAADADDRLQKDEDAAYAALAKAEKAQAAAEADTDADRFRAAVAAEEKARAALLRARGEYLARLVRPYMPDVPCNNTARDSQPLTYLTLMVPLLRTIDAYAQETVRCEPIQSERVRRVRSRSAGAVAPGKGGGGGRWHCGPISSPPGCLHG